MYRINLEIFIPHRIYNRQRVQSSLLLTIDIYLTWKLSTAFWCLAKSGFVLFGCTSACCQVGASDPAPEYQHWPEEGNLQLLAMDKISYDTPPLCRLRQHVQRRAVALCGNVLP